MVDGASRLGAIVQVTLPLALPGIVTALIFTFISAWNEFIVALTLDLDRRATAADRRLSTTSSAPTRWTGSTCSRARSSPPSR